MDHRETELLEVARREDEETGDEGRGQGREHRREEPARAPAVETREAEAPVVELAEDQPRDQIAADDEEDVDADEAAAKARDGGVKEENGQDGDGAQAVHLRPVGFARTRRRGRGGRGEGQPHGWRDDTRPPCL